MKLRFRILFPFSPNSVISHEVICIYSCGRRESVATVFKDGKAIEKYTLEEWNGKIKRLTSKQIKVCKS